MEAVVLSKKNFEVIQEDLEVIKSQLKNIVAPAERFIDNKAFVSLMGISSRTAQNWRDEGKIGYSQEGKKIYYRMSDIVDFLDKKYRKPFADTDNEF